MIKNILVAILCFSLLFVAFHPEFFGNLTVFDTLDGHKQVFLDGLPRENCALDDFLISPEGLYVCTSEGAHEKFVKVDSGNKINDSIYSFLLTIDSEVPSFYGDSCFYGDSKIDFWYGSSDPLSKMSRLEKREHYCDLWYDTTARRCFVFDGVLWYASSNELLSNSYTGMFSFDDIFSFGYELTIGTVEVVTSIFKGPEAFVERFNQWRVCIFGDVTVFDFIDNFTDRLPVIREIKNFVKDVIEPLNEDFGNLVTWIQEKIK